MGCGARAALRAAAGAHWRGPVARGAPRRSLALRHPPPPRRRARSRDSGTAPTAEPRRRIPAIGRPRGPAAAFRPGLPHAPHKAAHAPILLAVAGVTLPGAARAPHPPARLRRLPPPHLPPRPAPRPPAGRARRGVATRRPQGLPGRSASLFVRGGGGGAPPARSESGALARPNPVRARSPARRPPPAVLPGPARRRRSVRSALLRPGPPRAAPAPHLRSRPRSGGGPAAPGAPGPGPGPRAWWRRGAERTAPPDVTAPPGRGLAGRGRGLCEGAGLQRRGWGGVGQCVGARSGRAVGLNFGALGLALQTV